MDPLKDPWQAAWESAAWAPDEARESLIALATEGGDDLALAKIGEVLAKVFAVTGAWDLARTAYEGAAMGWFKIGDEARGLMLRAIAAALPLIAFEDDREAMTAELDLVRCCLDPARPPPLLRRAVVELRRALAPRAITGQLEAAFGLAPEEVALVMAAIASIIDDAPLLPAEAWQTTIAPSSLGSVVDAARVVRLGLVRQTPALVPDPRLVSRVLGRTSIDQPPGLYVTPVEPTGTPPHDAESLGRALTHGGIGIIVGEPGSGRRTCAANIAATRGWQTFDVQRTSEAPASMLAEAALEAGLHHAVIVIDLAAWPELDLAPDAVAPLLERAPVVVVCRAAPDVPDDRRAFTIRTWVDQVSSPG